MANMATYLDTKVADYTATELDITPQNALVEEGQKTQYQHEFDSGDLEIVTTSNSYFTVSIQWEWLSYGDAETILDFYHDKVNGKKDSFYWPHPFDGNTYVVKFASDLTRIYSVKRPDTAEISEVVLRVEGVKA